MSDEVENKPTLGRRPLGLKPRIESGEVKQTFSHGRTNKVVVEVKRKKLVGKPGYTPEPEAAPPPPAPPVRVAAPAPAPRKPAPGGETPQERVARLQREAEEDRLRLAEEANRREVEERARAAEDERRRAEENRKEAAVPKPVAEPMPEPEVEAAGEATVSPPPARRFTPVESPKRTMPAPAEREREEVRKAPHKPSRDKAGDHRRQSGKLTVTRALDDDEGARARSLAALKRAREKERRLHSTGQREAQPKQVREVAVPEAITVQELAIRMAEKGSDLVKALFKMGMPVTLTQTIDQDTAELLVTEFGHTIKRVSDADVDIVHDEDIDAAETLKPRAPVVTVMGHVDHGKTSLLDALRGANVQAGEAGGITQHIGAYQVKTKDGQAITFLDTPGHEAFTEMRARGATVTDIVILVVAADDGLMPQTIEAINHAKAANVPMIVAINKVDKEGANPQRVRERLLEHEVIVEKMGGEVQDVEVSALKKTGLDELLEKIALQAELMELKANPDRAAEAVVIEAELDKGRGSVATVLIRRGTLKTGDIFVVGEESGKVRALINDKGQQVKTAHPSMPVEVLGLSGVPGAGDILTVVENEGRAREVAAFRKEQAKLKRTTQAPASLDTMFSALSANRAKEYAVVVKADVQGSVEAIVNALHKLSTDEIKVRVLSSGVGAITESDVNLANASKAPIIGFNVRPNAKAREIAQREKTRFKYFDVIYHLTEDVAKEMAGILGPEIIETVVGRAKVQEVFNAGKKDKAAGLLVLEGHIRKGYHTRLTREDVIVSKTVIASLRRFKDDVDEVRAGLECGVVLQDTNDIKPGDMLEIFEVEERERTL
jgi:translation initiation factor IF-2